MFLLACGPVIEVGEGGGTTEAGGEGPQGTALPMPTTEGTTTVDPATTIPPSPSDSGDADSSESGDTNDTHSFLADTPPTPGYPCSTWDQDCGPGEKCTAWANDGGPVWNANRCVPIADDPVGVGEPCTVEDSGTSGLDNCDGTSMCFGAAPEGFDGTCHAFCTGSENDPMCADSCGVCSISNEGVLNLCLASCNPVTQDCPDEGTCFEYQGHFICAPFLKSGVGVAGDACLASNDCAIDHRCLDPSLVPDCPGPSGCCSPLCMVGDATGCAALPGSVCESLFDDDEGPDPTCVGGTVGVCTL